MTGQAVTLTVYGKPASPPSHSTWKTLRVFHSLTASTTSNSDLTLYRGTFTSALGSRRPGRRSIHSGVRPLARAFALVREEVAVLAWLRTRTVFSQPSSSFHDRFFTVMRWCSGTIRGSPEYVR